MSLDSTFTVYNASAGSGKTFTLVKEYLKIVLATNNIFKFKQILAVTFTNKAAYEMKGRVLTNLQQFANGQESILSVLIEEELKLDKQTLQIRSKNILDAILTNYSAFSITTIDSFTHFIIKSFAYNLGLPQNFDVEMNADELLKKAIDLLVSKIGINTNITSTLLTYAKDKANKDQSWDINKDLFEFSLLLLNEDHVRNLQKLDAKSFVDFKSLYKELKLQNQKIEEGFIKIGKEGIEKINSLGLTSSDFSYKDLPNHFEKLNRYPSLKYDELKFNGRLNKSIEQEKDLYTSKTSAPSKEIITQNRRYFVNLYEASKQLFNSDNEIYRFNKLILKSIIPLATLRSTYQELQMLKKENNLQLNSEFNHLISKYLQHQPAPFIYEQIGNKYQHYFIDEMQDTSQMQWENLTPLLLNTLSQESTSLFLVGDAKQSIYRWRGGKPEQFINLGNKNVKQQLFPVNKKVQTLTTNYRSFHEVVEFNNEFFNFTSRFLKHKEYQNLFTATSQQNILPSKKGGYISIDFIEDDKTDEENQLRYAKQVVKVVSSLKQEFNLNEICVLVRTRKEGTLIAGELSENDIPIISSETLLLNNSAKVQFLINLLGYFYQKTDDITFSLLAFLHQFYQVKKPQHRFFEQSLKANTIFDFVPANFDDLYFSELPLYEKMEYAIKTFQLVQKTDAYVQFFLDVILQWQHKGFGISEVLEQWELKKESLSIVSTQAANAVQVMTIHKSKGLEFPVVIYAGDVNVYNQQKPKIWLNSAFKNFDDFLIPYNKELASLNAKTEFLYKKRQNELEFDSLNLLYVALTRAKEQLYVITDNSKTLDKDVTHYSQYFKHYLDSCNLFDKNKNHYSFGSKKRVSKKETHQLVNHFYQEEYQSVLRKEHRLDILAHSSRFWGSQQKKAIDYGNLTHIILSKIYSERDIEPVLSFELSTGNISKSVYTTLKNQLYKITQHPLLKEYYKENTKVMNERAITNNIGEIFIPDRLIFLDNQVIILDYKTGEESPSHKQQLINYGNLLKQMGYRHIKKILVYLADELLVQEF